jgi:hypothetical protein
MSTSISPGHPGWVIVRRTWGKLEAEIVKGRLESAEIPVLLDYESAGPIIGIIIDGLGEVRVLVPAEHAENAQLALSRPFSNQDWDALPNEELEAGI